MRRMVPVVALVLLVGLAGCLSQGAEESPTERATPTVESPAEDAAPDTDTPTDSQSSGNVSVEYAIEAGDIPDEFESATVTMAVVFVETDSDFSENACWRDTYHGPHKPTPTPIGTPSGDCHRSQAVSIDLTTLDGTRTLNATAPGQFDAGHGLIVTDLSVTSQNGTERTDISGVGGHRASIVDGNPEGQYQVELAIEQTDGMGWNYALVSETDGADTVKSETE